MRKFISIAMAVAFTATGQQPPSAPAAPEKAEGSSTFTTNSSLVIVDVNVKDKSGKPIEGLKLDDFSVLEDGKPQKVTVFEYQKLTMDSEPPPALKLEDELKLPEAAKTTITSSTPGHIQFHDKRLLVFFLDFSSMGVPEQLRAQDASLDYLKKHITKDDMVAVMLYTSAIQVLTDFTDDRDVLTNIIRNAAHRRSERTGRPCRYGRRQQRGYRRGVRSR